MFSYTELLPFRKLWATSFAYSCIFLKIYLPLAIYGTSRSRKCNPFSAQKWTHRHTPSVLFFVIMGALEVPFRPTCWLYFNGPVEKWKCYKCCQFQTPDPFQAKFLRKPCLRVRFDDEFLQILIMFNCFGAPVFEVFGTNCCYNLYG